MDYEKLMRECIQKAKLGIGNVSPNPMVGCIVMDKSGKVISTGYHKKYGEAHAERDALLKVSKEKCAGGTLVVNLEPCVHYGKTPPCADLIIDYGIKKVIIGMQDINPIVAGKGIKKLSDAGILTEVGILKEECEKLNEVFIKNMTERMPFIAIKTAVTLDGKTATKNGDSKWITSEKSRNMSKEYRKYYDAILTSAATVASDNPTMEHKNKIIIDRKLISDINKSKIYNSGNIYVYYDNNLKPNKIKDTNSNNITFIGAPVKDDKIDLNFVINDIYKRGIMSVFVEAGQELCGSFVPFADKIYQFIAPKILGDNSAKSCYNFRTVDKISDSINFDVEEIIDLKPDILIILKKKQ